MSATDTIDVAALVAFANEAAAYFEKRPTGGEDMAHWSNVYNAENCRQIATALQSQAGALAEALAANAALMSERSNLVETKRWQFVALQTRATTAEASLATMREALEPFAKWPGYRPNAVDSTKVWAVTVHSKEQDGLAMGHFRRARRALGGSNAE